jgi:DNA repair exonuclease SbcCD nuclease subunit
MSRKPLAVVISDVHFKLDTLEVATAAFTRAIDTAAELGVSLIDAGDITNDKAILRAEVVNRLLELRRYAEDRRVYIVSIVGNHSLLNEKSTDANALEFIGGDWWAPVNVPIVGAELADCPVAYAELAFIPYQPNPEDFYDFIETLPKGSIVIGHQGTKGGVMGDYIQDHSAIDPKRIRDWRVFLGHYHQHYELENTVSIGNPYTLTFGEANDLPKGFLIVYDDGSYDRVLTHLRKHVIIDATMGDTIAAPDKTDIVWFKLRGTRGEIAHLGKEAFAKAMNRSDFKFEKIYTDSATTNIKTDKKTDVEIFDAIVDRLEESAQQKATLKALARELTNAS